VMPGLSGHETCRRIKAAPIVRDIPLIMLTALENREAMIHGLAAGGDDYIQKSADFEVVKARVRAQIRRKQFEDESRHIREELLHMEREVAEANAARELAELRRFDDALQLKNVELEDASRLKSEFLANMSHELRTPLNSIIGFSEVLKDGLVGELTSQQRKCVTDIFGSGTHLLALINDILDLSKIEAGKMTLDLEPVDVPSLLANSFIVVRDKAAIHHIQLEIDAGEGLKPILADARKVRQILYNLLTNAVKFAADGTTVTLRASRVVRPDVGQISGAWAGLSFPLADAEFSEFIKISVTDGGIGIAPDGLGRLFQPFTQIDTGLARRFDGAGLGLTIVKRLAELHGGTVAVESALGEGSCFTVWLPVRPPDGRPLTSATAPGGLRIEEPAGAPGAPSPP
jgi:signal transduction histidine kinase